MLIGRYFTRKSLQENDSIDHLFCIVFQLGHAVVETIYTYTDAIYFAHNATETIGLLRICRYFVLASLMNHTYT